MSMRMLYDRLPEIAMRETRAVFLRDYEGIPDGEYGFVELYCDDDNCDCQRVLINVLTQDGQHRAAVINYGWETPDFYVAWGAGRQDAKEMSGAFLDPMHPQGPHAPALLDLFREMLSDPEYLARFPLHYALFKITNDPPSSPMAVESRPNRAERRAMKRR